MDCANCGRTMALEDREPPLHGLCWPCASTALDEALETFTPFYLHGKALRDVRRLESYWTDISREGASHLCAGAFVSAIEFFEKYGVRKSEEES